MNVASAPSIAMASVIAAFGLFSLFLFGRRRARPPELLWAGVTCLLFSVYGFSSARLYSAASPADGADWQRYGVVAVMASCVALLRFIGAYTGGLVSRRWFWGLAIFFGAAVLVDLSWRSDLLWLYDVPAVKRVGGPFGWDFVYNEVAVGPLVSLQYVGAVVWFAYCFWVAVRFRRDGGDRRRSRILLIALAILSASIVNDILVNVEAYVFFYTSEYAYLAVVFVMAHAIADESVSASELIQERARLQERLRQAEKMEAIGRLAGGIAHDLNNMLTPIVGYVDIARRRRRTAEELTEYMARVGEAAEHARRLTWQLLAFGRKQMLHMRVLDLNEVVAGAEQMLRHLIPEDIEFDFALAADAGHVRADATQLQQILINLAINARDAMPGGGRMRVETWTAHDVGREDTVGARLPAALGWAVLAVADTGHGMDAETAARVFEPFFTTKDQGKGTGLGLATVYGIVRQHGGHVEVKTAPGQGAELRVYLPRVAADAPAFPEAPKRPGAAGAGRRVLVVEDEPSVRTLVREVLERHGYSVVAAGGPEEALALEAPAGGGIDLLITDVVMPGMNGFQLHERLVARSGPLRVLYMSGYSGDAIAERGVPADGIALLHKPFSVDDLLSAAAAVLAVPPAEIVDRAGAGRAQAGTAIRARDS